MMANQVAARLAGDDYQHLLAWYYLLGLLIPQSRILRVTVEDPDAGFVDDITMEMEPEATRPDLFLQVKYHVDQRSQYSTEVLLEKKPKGRSLLQKFYETWRELSTGSSRPVELRLVTNWPWDPSDPVGSCIGGKDAALSEKFLTASSRSDIGSARERWKTHLAVGREEFRSFISTLRFRLGYDPGDELAERTAERMMFLRVKHSRSALLIGVGIVRDLIKRRQGALDRRDVQELLDRHDLHLPSTSEPAVMVHLSTVKTQRFELQPDFLLDWRSYFKGDTHKGGHRVLDPNAWNANMLPELIKLEEHLNQNSQARLIRAGGLARLSAWFAFGFMFSDVGRYTIEVDQQGQLWRTDAAPSDLAVVERSREEIAGGEPAAVAIGISVTGSLEEDVREYLQTSCAAGRVLFLQADRDLGRECFQSSGDVAAFALTAKERIRTLVKEHRAQRVLLFYFGPLSGACFLGHQLNAVAQEIQIMEDQQPGYAEAFLLT